MELLSEMRGKATLKELSTRIGVSRFTIGRWLSGDAEPRLPELIAFVANTTLRLLDFIACFTNPDTLPTIRGDWRRLQRVRSLAYEFPWSHAVLRILELENYRRLPQHEPGWIARQLGIRASDESKCLELLTQTGQIVWSGTHFSPSSTDLVDTRTDPLSAQRLKAWWALRGLEKLKAGVTGVYSYNLGAVSREDLKRIEQLQRSFYRQMTQIIANSESPECLLLYCAQLVDLAQSENHELLNSVK